MYYSDVRADPHSAFPPEVVRLFPREREVAECIYARGLATANDVQASLSEPLCNAAVRSMLNRLVRKGLLTRARCGEHGAFVYGPALTDARARDLALRRFADDFFDGSLEQLAKAVARLPTA